MAEQRFISEAIGLVDSVGQSAGWWEGAATPQPQPTPAPVIPPAKDYTNLILGSVLIMAAVILMAIVISKKL